MPEEQLLESSPILPQVKPFVKWAGGKKQLLPEIRKAFPEGFGDVITKYAEPFVGGGAVLFDILSTYRLDEVYISDINFELINTYLVIRNKSDELIETLRVHEKEYLPLDEEGRKDVYYKARAHYNMLRPMKYYESVEIAALFIFLNRTCFNGLYRVSPKTGFNVPMGKYANPKILNEENLRNIAIALQNVKIRYGSYTASQKFIDDGTFVYFDPPYRPLSTTANFTSYAEDEFDDDDQRELAAYFKTLDKKGAKILLSNSDPKNTCPDDNFFDDLYNGFNIRRIQATRMINSKAENRGKIHELLISNY